MKLLVHEPGVKGHYLHSARLIAEAAIARGITTEISVRRGAASTPEFQLHMAPIVEKLAGINTFEHPVAASPRAAFAASGGECLNIARRRGADHIIMPAADGTVRMLALRSWGGLRRLLPKGVEIEIGLIYPTFARGEHGLARRAKQTLVAAAVARAPVAALRIADFPAYENLKKTSWARRQRLLAVPEPCEPARRFTRAQARALLGLPDTGTLLVATGEISGRKCPLELAGAFVRSAATDARLLFAGPCTEGLDRRIAEQFEREIADGRITVLNRLLTDEELDATIAAADIVSAVYSAHPGPSAILDRGMMMDRPVLAHNYGWSEYMVKRFALGWTTDPHNPDAYAATLKAALGGAGDFRPSPAANWLKSFFGMENFKRHWMMRLRQRMGLPPEEMVLWADAPPS